MSIYRHTVRPGLATVGNVCGMSVCGLVFVSHTSRIFLYYRFSWGTQVTRSFVFSRPTAAYIQKIKEVKELAVPEDDSFRHRGKNVFVGTGSLC